MKAVAPVVIVALLAGCQLPPSSPTGPSPESLSGFPQATSARSAPVEVQEVLAYHTRLRRAGVRELQQEQELARRNLLKAVDDRTRVRYALAMAMPGMTAVEQVRALDALDPVVRNAESPLNGMAILLATLLNEQRRVDMQAQALQQKLDALLELERHMTSRGSAAAKKR